MCQCPCPCPKEAVEEPASDTEESPETVVMNQLVEVYEEVEFSHADHADMVDEGCGTCHHHSPPGHLFTSSLGPPVEDLWKT